METEIELSFEDDSPISSVKISSYDFVGANASFINNWIANGMYGGVGLFEGIPFKIKACQNITIFDGCLDLQAEGNYFDCDRCTVALKQNQTIDWITDVADSFSFAYLASLGEINKWDFVAVPYVISSLPNYTQVAMLSMATFMMLKEAYELYMLWVEAVNVIIAQTAAATAMAVITIGTSYMLLIHPVLYCSLLAIRTIVEMAAMYIMVQQLIDNIIQPDKFKYGMYVRDLFTKACTHLGYTFHSSILNDPASPFYNLVLIPNKYTIQDPAKLRDKPYDAGWSGFWGAFYENQNAYGYFDGTFGDLIRAMNDVFNAKIRIAGTQLHFEVFDYWTNQSLYTLPDIVDEPHQLNASELAANYYISFLTDDTELNTYNDSDGVNAQCIFSPLVVTNQTNVLLKNLIEKTFIFAKAIRKDTGYTVLELMVIFIYLLMQLIYAVIYAVMVTVITLINSVIWILNIIGFSIQPINFPPAPFSFIFPSREGYMLLDTDYIGVPKILIGEQDGTLSLSGATLPIVKISSNNNSYVHSEYLIKNFHNHSFIFDAATGIHNQFYKYKDKEVPFCCQDYMNIFNCNWILTHNNQPAKALKLLWSPEKDEARIDYDVKKKWTNNIKQQYIIDGVEI